MTLFAYFGPETTLPVASAVVATIGFVLALARGVTSQFAQTLRAWARR